MNEAKRADYTAQWQRTFLREIARRKLLLEKKPEAAREMLRHNPRGLVEDCKQEHVWIPATTVWIHDDKGRGYKIDGFKRRGLTEAMPLKDKQNRITIVPQVCNNCCAMREQEREIKTEEQRKEEAKQEKKARRRARRKIEKDTSAFDSLDSFGL